jgi:hypothetical protein
MAALQDPASYSKYPTLTPRCAFELGGDPLTARMFDAMYAQSRYVVPK